MDNFTPEMIEKARAAKSAEELLALAQENNIEDFTEEAAKAYFDLLHPATGEVADDELESVTGGCYKGHSLIVTVGTSWCEQYECKHCHKTQAQLCRSNYVNTVGVLHSCSGRSVDTVNACGSCVYCTHDGALWKCYNPKKRK